MNTYPFAGVIKMEKVLKDGHEVIESEQVDMNQKHTGKLYISPSAQPDSILFSNIHDRTEILRITKDGVWVNPDMQVDEIAKAVMDAFSSQIKVLVQKAIQEEREACAKVCEGLFQQPPPYTTYAEAIAQDCADAIRARGEQ
jgi:hypothetical protein